MQFLATREVPGSVDLAAYLKGATSEQRVEVAASAGHPDPQPREALDYIEGFDFSGLPTAPAVFGPRELAGLSG